MGFEIYIQEEALKALSEKVANTLDDIVKEGLKRKGITFETNWHYGQFIEANCRKEVLQSGLEIYYVFDDPFLEYHRHQEHLEPFNYKIDESYKITATLGHYKYL